MASKKSPPPFKAYVLAAATVFVLFSPGSAGADVCVKRSEVPALEARLFQTELMVAALTCKRRQSYNSIIARFGEELAARGRSLKGIFQRLHGDKAEQRLNRFVTRLANEASLRSLRQSDYCDSAITLFDETLKLQPGTLTAFAAQQPFSANFGLAVCTGGQQLSQAE